MINVTRKDVMSAVVVDPGWYPVEVKKVVTKPANTDGSTNFIFTLQFLNPDLADARIKDFLINEKGLFSSGLAFLIACGFPKELADKIKNKEVESAPVDENACVGKQIKAMIKNTTYEGRVSNEATDFVALT